jgi:prevent-host-death family protein
MKTMPAGKFKAVCLKIMDDVHSTRQPLIVTKKGRPVVKLIPVDQPVDEIFGCLRGEVEILGDIVSSPVPLGDWKVLRWSCWTRTFLRGWSPSPKNCRDGRLRRFAEGWPGMAWQFLASLSGSWHIFSRRNSSLTRNGRECDSEFCDSHRRQCPPNHRRNCRSRHPVPGELSEGSGGSPHRSYGARRRTCPRDSRRDDSE